MPFDRNQPRGPDGKWIKKGGVFGAAVLATVVAAANGGDVVTSVGAGLDAATTRSVSDADTANSKKAAQKGDRACAACSTLNDADARFCKGCGQTLTA